MKTKLSPRFWCALTIFSLMGQIAWVVENMYFNVFIYKMFHASAADISLMVAASAVTATLTTVLMGALSDKLGKRKVFMCGGYILWGISIFSFVFLVNGVADPLAVMATNITAVCISLTIILDCVMTFFGSTANDAAFNAWLTDATDATNRGAAEGINAMMPLVSILVVFGGFMFFDLNQPASWTWIFTIIGVAVLLIGLLGFFLIKEPPIKPATEPYFTTILYGFRPKTVKSNPLLYLALAAFILFNISIQIFMPYLIIYYEVSLGMTDYVLVMAPAIVIASVVTALWGKVYDTKGFRFSGLFALASLLIGYVVLYFTTAKLPVFIGSLFMMCGYLAGMAVFGALIRDNTPVGRSGQLQGVRIFAQVLLPGVIGPFIGKIVLENAEVITNNDGTTSFVPNANIFLAAGVAALLVFPFFILLKTRRAPHLVTDLRTPFEDDLAATGIPFADYPRPSLKRDSYCCLNGTWDFRIENNGKVTYNGTIVVPFAPESRLSGVERDIQKDDILIYEKSIYLQPDFIEDRVLLHFGAVDQYATVYVNGREVGQHTGGYLPFTLDVTSDVHDGENHVRIEVRDPLCRDLPYGKQTDKRGGMWYTKVSGIWQTVWLESVPDGYIETVKIIPDLTGIDLVVTGGVTDKTVVFEGNEYHFSGDSFRLNVKHPVLWTPENPHLYDLTIRSGTDTVSTYFGLRTVSVGDVHGKPRILLNGKPYFFHGLLDQGYYSDGIFLPASPKGFLFDIQQMKTCGFNMLRKHIKLEPELFYYYCDKVGMIVFQDMINNGQYNFLLDTALPTAGLRRGVEHRTTLDQRIAFEETATGILRSLHNHPSVVYYTIFNEGWGQFDSAYWYQVLKSLDPTRVYDTTSGWFKVKETDVESDHIYFKKVRLKPVKGKPMVLSEFGGYSCKIPDHAYNLDDTYGYRHFADAPAFQQALIDLYQNEVIPMIKKGLCAAVLTQVSDIEDEVNGLLTYDRQVLKVDPKAMQQVSQALQKQFHTN
ncbi:MAG: MFS transporter [Clostridia bacterium]|nr:MFS transporter [Clostridia bacterium]